MRKLAQVIQRYAELEMLGPRERPEDPEFPFEGKLQFDGIVIDVENAKGSTRSGTDPDGNEWSIKMKAHYGEIRKSEGADGDKLDVYIGPSDKSRWVFVVHQVNPATYDNPGEFDETKIILGVRTPNEAIKLYQAHYDREDFFGGMDMVPIEKFKAWLYLGIDNGKAFQPPADWRPPWLHGILPPPKIG